MRYSEKKLRVVNYKPLIVINLKRKWTISCISGVTPLLWDREEERWNIWFEKLKYFYDSHHTGDDKKSDVFFFIIEKFCVKFHFSLTLVHN